jgi:hypothetical protein
LQDLWINQNKNKQKCGGQSTLNYEHKVLNFEKNPNSFCVIIVVRTCCYKLVHEMCINQFFLLDEEKKCNCQVCSIFK